MARTHPYALPQSRLADQRFAEFTSWKPGLRLNHMIS